MKTKPIQDVILTLQYCLETFEQTCQCGRCDPCSKGRKDIARAIRTMEGLQLQPQKLSPPSKQRRLGGAK
jgi:NADH:ubiquinone oxidoreductase subunit F (NADH-binding)